MRNTRWGIYLYLMFCATEMRRKYNAVQLVSRVQIDLARLQISHAVQRNLSAKNTHFRLGMSTYRMRGVAVSVIKHEVTPTVLGHAARSNTNPASNSLRERRILSLEAAEHGRFANDSQKESYSPPRAWKTTSNRMTVIAEKRVSRVRGKMDPWTMRFGCRN